MGTLRRELLFKLCQSKSISFKINELLSYNTPTLIAICLSLLDIVLVPRKFNVTIFKYLTLQWKNNCCMTSKVQHAQILRSSGTDFQIHLAIRCTCIIPADPRIGPAQTIDVIQQSISHCGVR